MPPETRIVDGYFAAVEGMMRHIEQMEKCRISDDRQDHALAAIAWGIRAMMLMVLAGLDKEITEATG